MILAAKVSIFLHSIQLLEYKTSRKPRAMLAPDFLLIYFFTITNTRCLSLIVKTPT